MHMLLFSYFLFWIADYIEDSADQIPNEDQFCLPTCMTKTEIYNNYVEEMIAAGVKPISKCKHT